MVDFAELQSRLGPAWAMNQPGGGRHVLVAMPSFALGESILAHYGRRIPALEHRYLLPALMLPRITGCQMLFLCSETPAPEVLHYYASLAPPGQRAGVRRRLRVLTVRDYSPRPVAAKLLERPRLLDRMRAVLAGWPAFIEPWNVTDCEVEVALRLGVPINGTAPDLWPLGYKGQGRRLLRSAGVPVPAGREGVRTVDDVCDAIAAIRRERPAAQGVVVKHDNSGAGDGNLVIELIDLAGQPLPDATIRERVRAAPAWYLADLALGGVVEELVTGSRASSPSVQVDITPYGDVNVLATHEQVLAGQVYIGCRFPADQAYAGELARHGAAIGRLLADRGVIGRLSVDFVAVEEAGRWRLYALEINLRKGGTTHPYTALRNLAPGRYDAGTGAWQAADGTPRSYVSTDNLVDPAWLGLPQRDVIRAVAAAGLEFDHRTGTGVVLHMLSCLAVDGRLGLTAIGRTPAQAQSLYDATAVAIAELASTAVRRTAEPV
ncbi:MAG TPA: peptide ligase PGM1-related protein [Kribbellaceae bacterium]